MKRARSDNGSWSPLPGAPAVEFRLSPLTAQILHLRFREQYWLCRTLLRVQEHSQHQHFRGRVFTLDDFYQWCLQHEGTFSYYTQWMGFCLRHDAFAPFFGGQFDPLSPEEAGTVTLLRGVPEPFFVIATYEGRPATRELLRHEMSHALFGLDPLHEDAVRQLMLGSIAAVRPVLDTMRTLGFHSECRLDEAQALLLADLPRLRSMGIELEPLRPVIAMLRDLFVDAWRRHERHNGLWRPPPLGDVRPSSPPPVSV